MARPCPALSFRWPRNSSTANLSTALGYRRLLPLTTSAVIAPSMRILRGCPSCASSSTATTSIRSSIRCPFFRFAPFSKLRSAIWGRAGDGVCGWDASSTISHASRLANTKSRWAGASGGTTEFPLRIHGADFDLHKIPVLQELLHNQPLKVIALDAPFNALFIIRKHGCFGLRQEIIQVVDLDAVTQ